MAKITLKTANKNRLELSSGSVARRSGAKAERKAARFLMLHGYRILERNFRFQHKEIDLIAKKGETIAFIEVKARRNTEIAPMLSVNAAKRRNVISASGLWCAQHGIHKAYLRYDIMEVDLSKRLPFSGVRHIENAFAPDR